MNCVANGRLLREGPFDRVWIQPAAGDAGGAIGAALFAWHQLLDKRRQPVEFASPFLGPKPACELKSCLGDDASLQAAVEQFDSVEALVGRVADLLAAGETVGWMQDSMEFGPRALGNRSILASPQAPAMKDRLNERVKFRESFRPFAPVVLEEKLDALFDLDGESAYMSLAAKVKNQALIPSATHIDGTARVQTVSGHQNSKLYRLLREFESKTDCPALINTSFNVRGQPIVCSVEDAVDCFFETGLDVLVVGNSLLRKSALSKVQIDSYRHLRARVAVDAAKAACKPESWFKRCQGFLHTVSFPVRWLASRLFLTTIYFLLVTPIGLLRRRFNRPQVSQQAETYWRPRLSTTDKTNYFKQY